MYSADLRKILGGLRGLSGSTGVALDYQTVEALLGVVEAAEKLHFALRNEEDTIAEEKELLAALVLLERISYA